jgi:hypothetical protein
LRDASSDSEQDVAGQTGQFSIRARGQLSILPKATRDRFLDVEYATTRRGSIFAAAFS